MFRFHTTKYSTKRSARTTKHLFTGVCDVGKVGGQCAPAIGAVSCIPIHYLKKTKEVNTLFEAHLFFV